MYLCVCFPKVRLCINVPSGFLPNPVCTCKYRQKEWVFLSTTSWFFTYRRLYTNPLLASNPSTTAWYPSPLICEPIYLPPKRSCRQRGFARWRVLSESSIHLLLRHAVHDKEAVRSSCRGQGGARRRCSGGRLRIVEVSGTHPLRPLAS